MEAAAGDGGASALLPSAAGLGVPSVGEDATSRNNSSSMVAPERRRRGRRRALGGIGMAGLIVGGLALCTPHLRGASAFSFSAGRSAAASAGTATQMASRHRSSSGSCHHPTRPPSRLAAAAGGGADAGCGCGAGSRQSAALERVLLSRRGSDAAPLRAPGTPPSRSLGQPSKDQQQQQAAWRPRQLPSAVALLCTALLSPMGLGLGLGLGGMAPAAVAEDELAQYAKEGNKVGVDARCFVQKCSLPTHECLNNPDCLKGLSCLSKCKGEGTCSTACFAKYGNGVLDDFLHCAVEQQDCVHVPRDRSRATWTDPAAVASNKKADPNFDIRSLEGRWYKVMGMDARYDCFDCQVNHFSPKPGQPDVMLADVQFRMPRPRAPGFWENHITEELLGDGPGARRSMHSVGRMFGLTFWENWYVIGENGPAAAASPSGPGATATASAKANAGKPPPPLLVKAAKAAAGPTTTTDPGGSRTSLPPYKFIYYTGHTLQGNYEGAFVYARTPELPPELMPHIAEVARANGLDPTKFCRIRNTCFRQQEDEAAPSLTAALDAAPANMKLVTVPAPPPWSPAGVRAWVKARTSWLPQAVGELTARVNMELEDWFEDPIATSDWLIRQQERMVLVADDPDGASTTVASAGGGAAGAGAATAAAGGAGSATALAKKTP